MAHPHDPEQLTGEIVQVGTVASVDHAGATCTVRLGDLVTGELPWLTQRAGGVRIWSPPSIGEQCVVLCPEGDLASGIVALGLFSDANPAPSADPQLVRIAFPDGASIAYDHGAHALHVVLPAGGTATVDAPGGLTINAAAGLTINADITVNGKLTASEDVVAAGISLKNHKHVGVQAGAAQTGAPV